MERQRHNSKVRAALAESGVRYYELADALHVSPGTLSVKLRRELPAETQSEWVRLIADCAKGT